jgi:hypothetical protein
MVIIAPAVASKLRKSVTTGKPPVTTLIESATQLVMQTTIAIPGSIAIPPIIHPATIAGISKSKKTIHLPTRKVNHLTSGVIPHIL